MCGRYTDTKRDKQFLVRMGVQADLEFTPRNNIAPTQPGWIVALDANLQPELKLARWGLIPFWAEDETIGRKLFNARGETVAGKPAFRRAFRKQRCLVLADGFYEWQKTPGGKIPILFHLDQGRPFAFGGLWERWEKDGQSVDSFTIITVEPNEVCAKIHNRMPLILPESDYARWLDPATVPEACQALLAPYRGNDLLAEPQRAMPTPAGQLEQGSLQLFPH